jgi:hypothetical protein
VDQIERFGTSEACRNNITSSRERSFGHSTIGIDGDLERHSSQGKTATDAWQEEEEEDCLYGVVLTTPRLLALVFSHPRSPWQTALAVKVGSSDAFATFQICQNDKDPPCECFLRHN